MHCTVDKLTDFATQALIKTGMSEKNARLSAIHLAHTDAAGIHSHGLKNLRGYIHKMQLGAMNPRGEAEVLREKGALALLDAHDALGTVGTTAAMDKAIALGKEHGLALVTVKNSSHFGAPFLFPVRAAEAGLIALLLTNTDPNTGVPDGRGRVIGNNPLCYALPWQGHHPVVLDISLSATAAMKIIRASTRGEKLTGNVLYDLNGHYTDDPAWFFKGGALAPVGAHKGYGLSVLFEALTSVLSGGTPGFLVKSWLLALDTPNAITHTVITIDPTALIGESAYAALDAYFEHILATPAAEGSQGVHLPGQRAFAKYDAALAHGLEMPEDVISELQALASELALTFEAC